MIKSILTASLLLTAAPALAQTAQPAQPAGPPETTLPTPPTSDQTTTQSTTTTTTDPITQPTTGDASTTSSSTPVTDPATGAQAPSTAESDTVAATVEADWAKYDANSNGSLSRTELNKWLTDLQSASGQKAPGKSYLAAALKKADTDKSKSVSKEELTAFLKG